MAADGESTVPVTIVSGFLGAGKSTLVRHILEGDHGLRVAVVENEFASDVVGIEDAIVTSGANRDILTDFVELPNGCICCNVKDDLVDALSRLATARKGRLDWIVIETSGLADPGPVAALFWVDEDLEMGLRLDGVVTVVDGEFVASGLCAKREPALFEKQVALADVVLLNKQDRLEDGAVEAAERTVRRFNATAELCRTSLASGTAFPVDRVLGLDAYRAERVADKLLAAPAHGPSRPGEERPTSLTIRLEPDAVFVARDLDRALGQLLWANRDDGDAGPEIWRVKALVPVREDGGCSTTTWIYQGVGDTFEGKPLEGAVGAARDHAFVFIGKRLDRQKLSAALNYTAGPSL